MHNIICLQSKRFAAFRKLQIESSERSHSATFLPEERFQNQRAFTLARIQSDAQVFLVINVKSTTIFH